MLHRRRESAEHPFGSIKHWMGHGGFLMRRLKNVRGEFSLTALAYNIRRATTLVGIPELIAAWGVQTSWNRPPKGPVATHQGAWHQRIDDNPRSRPKSQASHTARFDSVLLFTQSRSLVQLCQHSLDGVGCHRSASHDASTFRSSTAPNPRRSSGHPGCRLSEPTPFRGESAG